MLRSFSLIIIALTCVSAVKAQYESIRSPLSGEEKERISRYNLKSMKLYFLDGGHDSLIQSTLYDRNGKLTKTLSEGVIYNYTYDNNGNTISMTDSMLKNPGGKEVGDTFTFQYDENGFLKHAKFNEDESFFTFDPRTTTLVESRHDHSWPEPVISAYTYNAHKDITEMHYTNPADQSKITEMITYNSDYKITRDLITRAYGDGNLDTVLTYFTYNDKGKQVSEETYNASYSGKDNKTSRSQTIRKEFYDGQQRLIEEFLFDNGKEKERYIFTYAEYGSEPLSETYFSNGIQERVDSFELGQDGLPTSLTETEGGFTTKYKYEFQRW